MDCDMEAQHESPLGTPHTSFPWLALFIPFGTNFLSAWITTRAIPALLQRTSLPSSVGRSGYRSPWWLQTLCFGRVPFPDMTWLLPPKQRLESKAPSKGWLLIHLHRWGECDTYLQDDYEPKYDWNRWRGDRSWRMMPEMAMQGQGPDNADGTASWVDLTFEECCESGEPEAEVGMESVMEFEIYLRHYRGDRQKDSRQTPEEKESEWVMEEFNVTISDIEFPALIESMKEKTASDPAVYDKNWLMLEVDPLDDDRYDFFTQLQGKMRMSFWIWEAEKQGTADEAMNRCLARTI